MRKNSHEGNAPATRLRCAIYTRKSTEEGLEQDFSSLDAQREAAEAFIQSQRREGWIPLPGRYDDGGFTGANMDRPALQRLLAAVEAGELDCVVVYKVDRARRKGKWVGGCPVLGYDVDPGGGRLVVNEEEAERVRAILALLEEHGSIMRTLAEIQRRGWRLKSWTRQTGKFRAGGPFTLHSLRRLATNILYTGAIRHQGQTYPGEHAAILAPGVWERAQELITQREAFPHGRLRNKHLALLNGLLYCECCAARMVYSYAMKKDRKYPYYVCLNAQRKGWAACPSKSLPARGIEESVVGRIREAQRGVWEASEWEKMDRIRQVAAIQAVVERIGYDGAARQISIRFRQPAAAQEAQA